MKIYQAIAILLFVGCVYASSFNYQTRPQQSSYQHPPSHSFTISGSGTFHQGKPHGELGASVNIPITSSTSITAGVSRTGQLDKTGQDTGNNGASIRIKQEL